MYVVMFALDKHDLLVLVSITIWGRFAERVGEWSFMGRTGNVSRVFR